MILNRVNLVKVRIPSLTEFNILGAFERNSNLRFGHRLDDFSAVLSTNHTCFGPYIIERMVKCGWLKKEGNSFSITERGISVREIIKPIIAVYSSKEVEDTVEVPD